MTTPKLLTNFTTKYFKLNNLFILFFSFFFLVYSCKDKYSDFGIEVLPEDVLLSTYQDSMFMSGYQDNSFIIDAKNPYYVYLGEYTDPIFGKTSADLVIQFVPANNISWIADMEKNTVTKVEIILQTTTSNIGDTNAFKINVNTIKTDSLYFRKLYTSDIIETQQTVNDENNNSISFYQKNEIRIPLSNSFGEQLIKDTIDGISQFKSFPIPDSTIQNYKKKFKGLLLKVNTFSGSNSILKLNAYSSNSAIKVSYRNSNNQDTSAYFFIKLIEKNTNYNIITHLNLFKHDYLGTSFQSSFDTNPDSLLYIKGLGGACGRLKLPSLSDIETKYGKKIVLQRAYIEIPLYMPNIKEDSTLITKIAINYNDTTKTTAYIDSFNIINSQFPLAQKLYAAYKKPDGTFALISDYIFNGNIDELVDGKLDTRTKKHTINITKYMQEYISGKANEDIYFILETSNAFENIFAIDPGAEYTNFNNTATIIDAKNIILKLKYNKY